MRSQVITFFRNTVSQISDECKVIYKSFLDYLKGPDSAQGNADNICSKAQRIGVAIGAHELKDLLDSSKIREQYLTYCNEKTKHKSDSIRKYLRSLNHFYTFLVIRRKELIYSMEYISNEELILLQQKITNWSGQYKKKGRERYLDRQMEDYEILVDDTQIEKYCGSSHAQEALSIFRELHLKERKLFQSEYCTVRDNLFVIIVPVQICLCQNMQNGNIKITTG